jgi:hypothetical protein
MLKINSLLAAAVIILAASLQAQDSRKVIVAEGGTPDDRASARVLYWNQKLNTAAGQFAMDYGRPVWKKEYEDTAKFDALTKGKVWRMGSNFWTTLVSDLPLNISGKDVPAGFYYLGLHRSSDGSKWSLAFIDPAGVRKTHLDAFDIRKAKVDFLVPVQIDPSRTKAEKLTITLNYPETDIKDVTMKIAWGNLALSAPVKATVPE